MSVGILGRWACLGRFQFRAIMNVVFMDILVHVFIHTMDIYISVGNIPRSETAGLHVYLNYHLFLKGICD